MNKPYLSIVVTARNDNYGGNWINRINAFLKVLAYQAKRIRKVIEVVFVEYNPPQGTEPMSTALDVPRNEYLYVRFIIVPKTFHEKLQNNEKVTVCEFIGKNIGAYRSKADWILATNPDIIFSNEIFDFINSNKLNDEYFYRVNRRDLSIDFIPPDWVSEKILKVTKKKIIKILRNDGTIYTSYRHWLLDLIHGRSKKILFKMPLLNRKSRENNTLHSNAAGDFVLASRRAWNKVGGYDEITVGSGVLDGYFIYMLYCSGLNQKILDEPIYHIYHHHKGVKYLASQEKFAQDAKLMMETRKPYKNFKREWGFPHQEFEEIIK